MQSTPSITIVIPVYQRADLIVRTLDSVFDQTFRPLKLIVVDNGSTDGSRELAESWAESHRSEDFWVEVVSETRRGAAAARNCGLAMVDTPWTMFFDSDDLMQPQHVSLAMAEADACPETELIGWDVRYHMADGVVKVLAFEPDDLQYHNLMHASLATQRYMARTSLFRCAGGWNEKALLWDDIELGTRLSALQPHVIKRPGPLTVDVFHTPESISSTSFSRTLPDCLDTLQMIRRHYPKPSHVDLKEAILLGDCTREGNSGAKELFRAMLKRVIHRSDRICYLLAYHGRRYGFGGLARLLKPFLS